MAGKTIIVTGLVAVPALLGLTGCTSQNATTTEPGDPLKKESTLTRVALPQELSREASGMELVPRPLSGIQQGAEADELAFTAAVQRGVQKCMTKKGFNYEIPPPFVPDEYRGLRVFGDVEYAERQGALGFRKRANPHDSEGPNRSTPGPHDSPSTTQEEGSREYYSALGGDPFGKTAVLITSKEGETRYDSASCAAIGEKNVVGDLREYETARIAIGELANDLYTMVENSAQWRELQSRWSACMSSKGYTFENISAANQKHSRIALKQGDGQPSDEQRKLAIAVTTCERKVNAAGHYKALVKHAEDTAGPEAESIINTYRELRTKAFARAKELNNTN